ncbi:GH13752 [Drosophila grimshawi]|uniref:GH13752 n=1 Tax=Drosophila grimshawi TaxID=7222 RepID=B4JQT2_DROGR|nr:GH13752 [Drosophila grimshawi]
MELDTSIDVDADVNVDATSCYDNNNATTNARCAKMKIMLQSSTLNAQRSTVNSAWSLVTDR